jgi:hypothetical protein
MPGVSATGRRGSHKSPLAAARGAAELILLSASQRVLASPLGTVEGGENWATAADELASLTLAVQSTITTGKAEIGTSSNSYLRQRLLDEIEAEVLNEQGEALTDPLALESLLKALNSVRSELAAGDEQSFQAPFSGPQGSELVAEI